MDPCWLCRHPMDDHTMMDGKLARRCGHSLGKNNQGQVVLCLCGVAFGDATLSSYIERSLRLHKQAVEIAKLKVGTRPWGA